VSVEQATSLTSKLGPAAESRVLLIRHHWHTKGVPFVVLLLHRPALVFFGQGDPVVVETFFQVLQAITYLIVSGVLVHLFVDAVSE